MEELIYNMVYPNIAYMIVEKIYFLEWRDKINIVLNEYKSRSLDMSLSYRKGNPIDSDDNPFDHSRIIVKKKNKGLMYIFHNIICEDISDDDFSGILHINPLSLDNYDYLFEDESTSSDDSSYDSYDSSYDSDDSSDESSEESDDYMIEVESTSGNNSNDESE